MANLPDIPIVNGAIILFGGLLLYHVIRDQLQYRKSPDRYLQKQVEILSQAIKDKNVRDAHGAFHKLIEHIDIGYRYIGGYRRCFSDVLGGVFLTNGYGAVYDVDWGKLKVKFLEILQKYKRWIPMESEMSERQIDHVIEEVTASLNKNGNT